MITNNFFKLFPNVIPVKGYSRSMLLDLYFGRYFLVPNSLIDLLENLEKSNQPLEEFLSQFNIEDKKTISDYIEFIKSQNLGIKCDEILMKSLIPIQPTFELPYYIENVIFEINNHSNWLNEKVFNDLEIIHAKYLEVRFLDIDSFNSNIDYILIHLEKAFVEGVEILVPNAKNLKEKLDQLIELHPRLWKITVYNSNDGFDLYSNEVKLFFTKQSSIESSHCGNISPEYFSIDTQSFLRNKNYNNCTAYKISIDKDGFVRNCPSNNKSYGHIMELNIFDLVTKVPEFKETWGITKDQVDVCKDCEFRMICSDCRVFVDNKNNIKSRPEKCSYNPYIAKWKNEPGYLDLYDTGVLTLDNGISIDTDKISNINSELWD